MADIAEGGIEPGDKVAQEKKGKGGFSDVSERDEEGDPEGVGTPEKFKPENDQTEVNAEEHAGSAQQDGGEGGAGSGPKGGRPDGIDGLDKESEVAKEDLTEGGEEEAQPRLRESR